MAQIISKDRVPYKVWSKLEGLWHRQNFLTNAKSVDADDGETLETKVGAINGITSDLSCEDESVALSAIAGKQLNGSLGGLSFYEDEDGNKYVVGADSVPKKLGDTENLLATPTYISRQKGTMSTAKTWNITGVEPGRYLLYNCSAAYNTDASSLGNVDLVSGTYKETFANDNSAALQWHFSVVGDNTYTAGAIGHELNIKETTDINFRHYYGAKYPITLVSYLLPL